MSLKDPVDLYFYSEYGDTNESFTGFFYVGLFRVASHASLSANKVAHAKTKDQPRRFWGLCAPAAAKLHPMPNKLDCVCVAGAMVQQVEKTLIVANIGADEGYGPTLYAAIIELARKRLLKGAMPCRELNKVLPKPTEIWRRFSEDPEYVGRVCVAPVEGNHIESWLNCVYSAANEASVINIDEMRANWEYFSRYWEDKGVFESTWSEMCRDKAQLSVDAHKSK